jgi:hypothetical protein
MRFDIYKSAYKDIITVRVPDNKDAAGNYIMV